MAAEPTERSMTGEHQQRDTAMVLPHSHLDPNSVAVHALDLSNHKPGGAREVGRERRAGDEAWRLGRRRVRFAISASDGAPGRVAEEVFRYRPVSSRRRELCYTSRREQCEAVDRARTFTEFYIATHEEWHGTIAGVFLSTTDGGGLNDGDDDDDDNKDDAVLILAASPARGLEFSSKLLRRHQEWANKSILRRHRQLQTDLSGEEADALLGEHCERLNRRARGLAAQLGRGDALQARLVYEEDGAWAKWKRDDRWEGDSRDKAFFAASCGGRAEGVVLSRASSTSLTRGD
jgi:hypothetical protein